MSLEVASHAHLLLGKPVIDSGCKFLLILSLLIPAPSLLALSLLLCDALVFRLERLQHRSLVLCRLILQHAPHSSNDSSLLGVGFLFVFFCLNAVLVLFGLLLNPSLLLGGLECDTLVVEQIFTFKLQAA